MDEFTLQKTFGYAILQASRMMTKKMNCSMAELGDNLTMEQGAVLMMIAKNTCDEVIQQDIAVILDKNKSAVLRTIDQLEKKGFLKRMPVADDRRKNHLEVTQEGHAIVDKIVEIVKAKDKRIRNEFSEQEICTFFSVLNKMKEMMELEH